MRIFGPVPSRRLGNSLGIDLCPFKTCSFNCIYCELGKTNRLTVRRKTFYAPKEILEDFKTTELKNVDVITFTASGEPTLYKGIDKILNKIKKYTNLPVVLLTNSSLFYRKEVIEEVKDFDIIVPSLDAVSSKLFVKINRPHPSLEIKKVIRGLKNLRKKFRGKMLLEVLFVKGFNDRDKEVEKLKDVIELISPDIVQLNTVYRPGTEKYAIPVENRFLKEVKVYFGKNTEVVGEYHKKKKVIMTKKMIEELIKHRPVTLNDLKLLVKDDELVIKKQISKLIKEGKVKKENKFFKWV